LDGCTFTVDPLRSRRVRPFLATMRPSDSRRGVSAVDEPLRFLDFSFPTRCLQSPRRVRRLHSGVASPPVPDFTISGRMVTLTVCNEAESSSLALRLVGSPHRASAWGLLLSLPGWLHDGHLVVMMSTFHFIREVRLGLTHPMDTDKENLDGLQWTGSVFIGVHQWFQNTVPRCKSSLIRWNLNRVDGRKPSR